MGENLGCYNEVINNILGESRIGGLISFLEDGLWGSVPFTEESWPEVKEHKENQS